MSDATLTMPWDGRAIRALPGYWFLGKMGKRILRPGGIALSRAMLQALDIGPSDDVVEYAPGLGATARTCLRCLWGVDADHSQSGGKANAVAAGVHDPGTRRKVL